MKKIFYFLASAIVALGAMACQNEVDENINPNETKEISFKVSFDESTRIAMGELTGGKLPFEFDGKGLNDGPDSLYVGYSRFNGESYDTKRAFLVNSEENPYEFVADAENQAILQELVGEENIHVVNRNNETVVSADGENGLLFKSEEFDLVAGENEVSLSLACPAFYFTVPEGTEVVFSAKRGDNSVLTEIYHPIPEASLVSRVESLTFGEGTHIVGVNQSYNPAVTIAYSVNGVTVKEASLTLTNKVYNLGNLNYEFTTINTKEQLIAFAAHVNAGNSYEGKTVKLGNDINLGGAAWTPIGNLDVIKYANVNSTFLGTFDGQGYTISNFTIEQTGEAVGFFGAKFAGDIKDVKFDGVTVTGTHYGAVVVGWTDGAQRNADGQWNITGCEVTNSTVTLTPDSTPDNGDKAGAIVGYAYAINVTGNTVSNTTIQAYRDLGAIAGMAQENTKEATTVSGNTVGENVTVIVDNTVNYKNYTTAAQYNAGNYVGRISTNSVVENNTGEATIVLPKTAVEELNEQIANSEGNTTITLTDDIVAGENEMITIPAGKTITLNLNGKTISQEKECTASHQLIKNNGTLTITGNGKISFKDTSAGDSTFGWGSYTIHNSGNLTVENGTIEHIGEQAFATHMICAIFQYSGTTTINGGVISTPNYRSVRLWKGNMTINGGEFDGQLWVQAVDNTANLVITDGTFGPNGGDGSSVFVENKTHTVDVEITGGTFTTKLGASSAVKGWVKGGQFKVDPSAYVADGYKAIENEGVWTVNKVYTVYVTAQPKSSAADWETINLYAWNDSENNTWPGADITANTKEINGYTYHYFTFPASFNNTEVSVIVNNGTDQTDDIVLGTLNKDYYVVYSTVVKDVFTEAPAAGSIQEAETVIVDPKPETTTIYLQTTWSWANWALWGWTTDNGDKNWFTKSWPGETNFEEVVIGENTYKAWDVPSTVDKTKTNTIIISGEEWSQRKQTANFKVDITKDVFVEIYWDSTANQAKLRTIDSPYTE